MKKENKLPESWMKRPYQLFDDLPPEQYEALKEDIRIYGVRVPIEMDERGEVLDGHNRLRAWIELKREGVEVPDYPTVVRTGMNELEKRLYVRSLNLNRRQLTPAQRRQCVADELKETPDLSDRQIES